MAVHLLNSRGIGGILHKSFNPRVGLTDTRLLSLSNKFRSQGIRNVIIVPLATADASFKTITPDLLVRTEHGFDILAIPEGAAGVAALSNYPEKIGWLLNAEPSSFAEGLANHFADQGTFYNAHFADMTAEDRGFAIILKGLLETLIGKGTDFSLSIMNEGIIADRVLVSSAERTVEPIIGNTVAGQLGQVSGMPEREVVPRYVPGVPGVPINYLNSLGAIDQSLEAALKKEGPTVALLVGGDATRLFRLVENKSWVPFGARTNGEAALLTASLVLRQLPAAGQDWVVVIACDNVAIPDGPITVAGKPLSMIEQGAAWFGLSTKVVGVPLAKINHLKELGIFITNKAGTIVAFEEKKSLPTDKTRFDQEYAVRMLSQHQGGETVEANTYIMAFRRDVAKIFVDGYAKPTKKDGRPFHETYSLDLSKHFTTATTITSREKWANKCPEDFNSEDWEYLWLHAQAVVRAAKGIAGASLGFSSTNWSDMGSLKEAYDRNMALGFGFGDAENIKIGQQLGKLPELGKPRNSKIAPVAAGAKSIVGESAFTQGGSVADHSIVLSSLIEASVSIPSETVVLNSELHNVRFEGEGSRLLIGVHQRAGSPELVLKAGMAYFSMYLENGESYITGIPIEYVGSEKKELATGQFALDPYVGHYFLNGAIKDQPMLFIPNPLPADLTARIQRFIPDESKARVPSINNLKKVTSIALAQAATDALKEKIRSELAQ